MKYDNNTRVVLTYKALLEMGLNGRVVNPIEVILDPTDGGDARNDAVFMRPLPRERVAGEGRQRQELPGLRAFLRWAQPGDMVRDPDKRSGAFRRRRAYSRIFPPGHVAAKDAGAPSPHRFSHAVPTATTRGSEEEERRFDGPK